MIIRKYENDDLSQMINLWNEVVEDGIAFPQEELLTEDEKLIAMSEASRRLGRPQAADEIASMILALTKK